MRIHTGDLRRTFSSAEIEKVLDFPSFPRTFENSHFLGKQLVIIIKAFMIRRIPL